MNPIIPGYAPDPSIVFVDGWYFLVNSSFHTFPGLPIYASQNLASWKHIGNAFNRPEQLSLAKSSSNLVTMGNGDTMLASGGLYAPTIRFNQGTFYIACTNILHLVQNGDNQDKSENFIMSTNDIWASKWSDPVYFEFQGIDPDIFFHPSGSRVFVHGSQGPGPWTKIQQFELDLETGKKLSPERTIWQGTGGIFPEGPHMYWLDGWYYLEISEGGTHERHMVTMARSRNVEGPFEPCPHNPILTASGTENYIQYTGHCDIFQDQNNNWLGVCLGVRKDRQGRIVMGRETFLTMGHWQDGWLKLASVKPELPIITSKGDDPQTFSVLPNVDIVYIRDAKLDRYQISNGGEDLILDASSDDLSSPDKSPTFLGKRQRRLEGKSTVTIVEIRTLSESAKSIKIGLACIKEEHRYCRVFYDLAASEVIFELHNAAQQIFRTNKRGVEVKDCISFQISYTEEEYRFWYRIDQGDNQCFAKVDTLEMTGTDFVGPIIGVYAVSDLDTGKVKCTGFSVE